MGARTDAARAEVLAQREELRSEVQRLEAAGRAAIDIPARARRAPAQTAGLAVGTAFLVLGGPQRLFRRARRAVFGPEADLPRSMLPKDVEKTLRRLGTDGDKVRGTLEHEFARYLDERSKLRRNRELTEVAASIAGNLFRPVSSRLGRQLAERFMAPDAVGFDEALARVRARWGSQGAAGGPVAPGGGQPATGASRPAPPPVDPVPGSRGGSFPPRT